MTDIDHSVEPSFDGRGVADLESRRDTVGALSGLGDRVCVKIDAEPACLGVRFQRAQ
jgi:hypothetical protein